MVKNKTILLLLCLMSLMLFGCANKKTNNDASTKSDANNNITINEGIVDEIKSRGYLIVGCKSDVPNLGYYDGKEWSGIEVELAYEVTAEIFGVDKATAKDKDLVKFVAVTVADREEKLESGEIDLMLATYTYTDERAEKFALSDSYYTDYIGMMVKKSAVDNDTLGGNGIKSMADLDGKYIGVPRNATTRDHFIKYIETMDSIDVSPIFCEYESYEQLYNALKNGNIDVMSVDVSILNGYLDDTLTILPERFGGQKYVGATKLENQLLLESVNKAINK